MRVPAFLKAPFFVLSFAAASFLGSAGCLDTEGDAPLDLAPDEQSSVVLEGGACDDLQLVGAQTCTGGFLYEKPPGCVAEHDHCAESCEEFSACAVPPESPAFAQYGWQMITETVEVSSQVFSANRFVPGNQCQPWDRFCLPRPFPDFEDYIYIRDFVGPRAACTSWLDGLIEDLESEPGPWMPGQSSNTYKTVSATPLRVTHSGAIPVPAAEFYNCSATLTVSRPEVKQHPECGCAATDRTCFGYSEALCPGEARLTYVSSAAALGDPLLRPAFDATSDCTTCETEASPQAAAACLQRLYNREPAANVADPEGLYRRAQAKRAQVLYELHGDALGAGYPDFVRALHETYDTPLAPLCGADIDPAVSPACVDEPLVEGLRGQLRLCQRLAGPHVVQSASEHELDRCFDLVHQVEALPATACVVEYRTAVRAVAEEVLKQYFVGTQDELRATAAAGRSGVLADALARAQAFLDALAPYAAEAELSAAYQRVLTALWQSVHAGYDISEAMSRGLLNLGSAEVADTVREFVGTSMQLDRDMLSAAVSPRAQLSDRTLIMTASGALEGLVRRLEELAPLHDFACGLIDCAGKVNPQADYWRLLASLTDTEAFANSLREIRGQGAWAQAFRALANGSPSGQVRLAAAMQAELERTGVDALDELEPAEASPWFALFVRQQSVARARARSFQQWRLLAPPTGIVVDGGLDSASRSALAGALEGTASLYGQILNNVDSDVKTALGEVLRESQQESHEAQIENRIARLADDLSYHQDRLEAHRNAVQETYIFDALVDQFDKSESAEDSEYIVVDRVTPLMPVRPADAPASLHNDLDELRVPHLQPISVARGQILQVQVPGQDRWSPTCALRSSSPLIAHRAQQFFNSLPAVVRSGLGVTGVNPPIDVPAGAETGSSGFSMVRSGDRYRARDSSRTMTVGVRGDACAGGSFGFGGATLCAYIDLNQSRSVSRGQRQTDSASFSSGFRLSNTPFPQAPVGSLLAVTVADRGDGYRYGYEDIVDVQVIHAPGIPIVATGNVRVFIVANDLRASACAGGPGQLNVSYSKMTPASEVGEALLHRLSFALNKVREARGRLENQGELLGTEISALRSAATLDLFSSDDAIPASVPDIPVSQYPELARRLFEAFLDQELVRLERWVRIVQIERDQDVRVDELQTLIQEQQRQGHLGQIGALGNRWTVGTANLAFARATAQALLRQSQTTVLPVFELWHPDEFESMRQLLSQSSLNSIVSADVDADVLPMYEAVHLAATTLVDRYRSAVATGAGLETDLRAVSFHHPDPLSFSSRHRRFSQLPAAPDEQSAELWNALIAALDGQSGPQTRATIAVSPDLLYSLASEPYKLSCYSELPVVKRMAVTFLRPGISNSQNERESGLVQIDMRTSAQQRVPSALGTRLVDIADDDRRQLTPKFLFSSPSLLASAFASGAGPRVLGISPFNTYELDFGRLGDDALNMLRPLESSRGRVGPTEIVLTFELEHAPTFFPVDDVLACMAPTATTSSDPSSGPVPPEPIPPTPTLPPQPLPGGTPSLPPQPLPGGTPSLPPQLPTNTPGFPSNFPGSFPNNLP